MSSNVHTNSGPVFLCLVCAGNVTWRGRSVQCCTCTQWVHLRCSFLSFSRFKTQAAIAPGAFLPTAILILLEIPRLLTLCLPSRTPPACIPLLCYLAHLPLPPFTNAALPRHTRLQTAYPPSVHFVLSSPTPSSLAHVPGCFSTPPASSSSPDTLRVLQ